MIPRLTARAKLFAERTLLPHYKSRTDAYLSVYTCKSTRRNATVNAARIYSSKPVQQYLALLLEKTAEQAALHALEAEKARVQRLFPFTIKNGRLC